MGRRHEQQICPQHRWIHQKSKDALEELGMSTLEEYINVCWQTIAVYMVTRPILDKCMQGKHKKGKILRLWWWE
jgi:hypothetical protein